jgi:predicted metal-binding membrane protein
MVILLVVGMMDVRAMAMVTIAITVERLSTTGQRAAHVIGVVALAMGLVFLVRTVSAP